MPRLPDPEPLPADFHLPPGLAPAGEEVATREGLPWRHGRWHGGALAAVASRLAGDGVRALAALPDRELLAAWTETVARFRDPGSPQRRGLDPLLAPLAGLSPAGLAAGLEVVLAGVDGAPAAALLARGRPGPAPG
ncbi:MAG: hypothetical protein KJ058_18540, partial [Thermoanaerobaculia bacterium]|nr:hypothetical protein [Thermoanaerobaculia bacterium]